MEEWEVKRLNESKTVFIVVERQSPKFYQVQRVHEDKYGMFKTYASGGLCDIHENVLAKAETKEELEEKFPEYFLD